MAFSEKGGVGRRRRRTGGGVRERRNLEATPTRMDRRKQATRFFPSSMLDIGRNGLSGRWDDSDAEGEGDGGLGLGFGGVGVGVSIVGISGSQDFLFSGRRVEASVSPTSKRNDHNAVTVRVPIVVDRGCFKSGTHHRSHHRLEGPFYIGPPTMLHADQRPLNPRAANTSSGAKTWEKHGPETKAMIVAVAESVHQKMCSKILDANSNTDEGGRED